MCTGRTTINVVLFHIILKVLLILNNQLDFPIFIDGNEWSWIELWVSISL